MSSRTAVLCPSKLEVAALYNMEVITQLRSAQAHLASVSDQLPHDGKCLSGTHHASSATSIVVPAAQQRNYCQRLCDTITAHFHWVVMLQRLPVEEHALCMQAFRQQLKHVHAAGSGAALDKVWEGNPGMAYRDCSILRRAKCTADLSHLAALQHCLVRAMRLQSHVSAIVGHYTQDRFVGSTNSSTGSGSMGSWRAVCDCNQQAGFLTRSLSVWNTSVAPNSSTSPSGVPAASTCPAAFSAPAAASASPGAVSVGKPCSNVV